MKFLNGCCPSSKYDSCVSVARRSYEWETLPDDHYVQRRNNRNRNLRCMNCREEGHRMHECYMPPRQIKCHMCGQIGHREPRCPQTMCLRVRIFSNKSYASSRKLFILCSVAMQIVFSAVVATAVIICKT